LLYLRSLRVLPAQEHLVYLTIGRSRHYLSWGGSTGFIPINGRL